MHGRIREGKYAAEPLGPSPLAWVGPRADHTSSQNATRRARNVDRVTVRNCISRRNTIGSSGRAGSEVRPESERRVAASRRTVLT